MIERYREIQRQKVAGEREDGFTLIELLIVIVVLGILAAVVVFALGGVTGSSVQSACNADAKTVQTAVAAYNAQNTAPLVAYSTNGTPASGSNQLVTAYLQSWPQNTGSNYAISYSVTNGVQVTVASTATPWSAGTFTAGTGTASSNITSTCAGAGV